MKSKVMKYIDKHNIEMEIEFDVDDKRSIDTIEFYAPSGYQFGEDLHLRCYGNLWQENYFEIWDFIYGDMCINPIIKCNDNCNCKELV